MYYRWRPWRRRRRHQIESNRAEPKPGAEQGSLRILNLDPRASYASAIEPSPPVKSAYRLAPSVKRPRSHAVGRRAQSRSVRRSPSPGSSTTAAEVHASAASQDAVAVPSKTQDPGTRRLGAFVSVPSDVLAVNQMCPWSQHDAFARSQKALDTRPRCLGFAQSWR
jgi:hypothetical protein